MLPQRRHQPAGRVGVMGAVHHQPRLAPHYLESTRPAHPGQSAGDTFRRDSGALLPEYLHGGHRRGGIFQLVLPGQRQAQVILAANPFQAKSLPLRAGGLSLPAYLALDADQPGVLFAARFFNYRHRFR